MASLAIIGGTGLTSMDGLTIVRREMVKTPYGSPSGPIIFGELDGNPIAFLARHGHKHSIPPHKINYRANIWSLQSVGITQVIAVGAVGGISPDCTNGKIVIPDQIIDYTGNRDNSFFDGKPNEVRHIDFSYPYSDVIRESLIGSAEKAGLSVVAPGIYGVTEGPRLETVAEIARMERDGCTIVGMTSMPEASLARELDMEYACCAVVVNPAAGKGKGAISMANMSQVIDTGMEDARRVIRGALPTLCNAVTK